MMLSVALCTYNGAQFIRAQIESILRQTLPVDEIVVCDDGSTDNTLQIIESFCQETPTKIRIYRNETNLGVCANFQKAVNLCNGDIIFLSDQDDVWYSHKTKTIVDWFSDNPSKDVVFTNAELIDESGHPQKKTLFDAVGFNKKIQDFFSFGNEFAFLYLGWNYATGATMALKTKYDFEKHCSEGIFHDFVIFLMSTLNKRSGFIQMPLMQYRLHRDQTEGLRRSSDKKRANQKNLIDPIFNQRGYGHLPIAATEECNRLLDFLRWRSTKNKISDLPSLLHKICRYQRTYNKKWLKCITYDITRCIAPHYTRKTQQ